MPRAPAMKEAVTSFDCLALAREVGPLLEGAWFDKAYQPAKDEVVVRLRVAGQGAREWRVKAGKWAYLSQGTRTYEEAMSPFAGALRTHLEGCRVQALRQVGFDRILEMDFAKAQSAYTLAFELFGEGNVVLVRDGKVLQPLHALRVAHRTVAPGEVWVHPPARLDPVRAAPQELHTKLMGSKADVVRTLATSWNLGGQYAEEVCARAGVAKDLKASTVTSEQRQALVDALQALLHQVTEEPEPVVVRDGAAMVDVTPAPLVTLEQHSFEARGAFAQALEDYATYFAATQEAPPDPRVQALQVERDRLARQVESQRASLGGFDAEAERLRALGDLLYGHFAEVEALLAEARARRDREGWDALKAWAGEPVQPAPFVVRGADGAEGMLTVTLGPDEVVLRVADDVHANAQRMYEAAKRQREKADGARAALAVTEAEVARLSRDGEALAGKLAREQARRKFAPTKRLWFEAYRWFLSSEGLLVLGGRDASSNDKLVKKHLDAQDRYVHADQAGAPSVVVKRGQAAGVGEVTLEEAAQFAVAYSKAWQRRIGSADAYWVTPEQVSKTPQPGEYLGKGAFIIRGKRNYMPCDLRAAVGEVEVEGHRKVMGGPARAVQARATRYLVLEPGDEELGPFARRLAEALKVPVEEVQAVLPPGPVRVVEDRGVFATSAD